MTKLSDLPPRSPARVRSIAPGTASGVVLMELGLVPGTRVEVIRAAPLGDPLEIDVTGARLALRKSDAASVLVDLL